MTEELPPSIDKNWVIQDIMTNFPAKANKLADVMTRHGLQCAGCGAATYETLEQGVLGHGMSEGLLGDLVEKLNLVIARPDFRPGDTLDFTVTENAIEMIEQVMTDNGAEGNALKLAFMPGVGYDMAFQDEAESGDIVIDLSKKVTLHIEGASAGDFDGVELDFTSTDEGSGFTFSPRS